MQGLLDFINSPEGRIGLLQFGAGMMQPTRSGSFGEALGLGIQSGIQGYSNALNMQDQRQQRELLKQQREMQLAQLQKRQDVLSRIGKPSSMAPTVANAQNPQIFDHRAAMQELLAAGDLEGVKALQALQPKYSAPHTVMGPDGKPMLIQLDEQGNARPMQGFNPYQKELDPQIRQANIDDEVAKLTATFPLKKQLASAGASQISFGQEKEEDKAVGKAFGEMYANLQKAGFFASNKIAKINRMEKLLQGIQTGKLTPATTEIASLAESIGLKIDPNLGPKQAVQALAAEMALSLRNTADGGGMPGALSDRDIAFLVSMTPSLAQTPEGNKLIMETAKKVAKREQEVAKIAREYRKKHGRIDEGFYDVLQEFSNANPLFPEAEKAPSQAGGWSIRRK